MTSAVLIVPAAAREAGNQLGESMGWGTGNYSVALSPTGQLPATHWGCRAEVSPSFIELLANPPDSALPVISILYSNFSDSKEGYTHFMDCINSLSLKRVVSE